MLSVTPKGYSIESSLNVFTDVHQPRIDSTLAAEQHANLCRETQAIVLHAPSQKLPDLVFTANAGLWLPRLPERVVLLSNMKHASRARETPWLEEKLNALGIKTIRFPKAHPYEGQGESVWFYEGKLLVVSYGYRSTAKTIPALQRMLNRVYAAYGVEPPFVLGAKMASPKFYHLDIAMTAVSHSACMVNRGAIANIETIKKYIKVHEHTTTDDFMMNMIVLPHKIITHKLLFKKDKRFIMKHTHQRPLVEVDVSEFEKSGGSVRCMVLMLLSPHDGMQ